MLCFIPQNKVDALVVQNHLPQVEEFSERDRWNSLSDRDTEQIAESLSHLTNGLPKEDEL